MMPIETSDIERQAYMVLGVLPGVTDEEVKRAYRYLAKMYHPDVSSEGDEATSKFKLITEAYQYIRQGGALNEYSSLTQMARAQTQNTGRQTAGLVYSSYGLDTARFDLIRRCLLRANIQYVDKTVAMGEGGFTTIYQEISVKPKDEKRAKKAIRRVLSSRDRVDGAFAAIAVMGIWMSVIGLALSIEIPIVEWLTYVGFGISFLSVVVKAVYDRLQP